MHQFKSDRWCASKTRFSTSFTCPLKSATRHCCRPELSSLVSNKKTHKWRRRLWGSWVERSMRIFHISLNSSSNRTTLRLINLMTRSTKWLPHNLMTTLMVPKATIQRMRRTNSPREGMWRLWKKQTKALQSILSVTRSSRGRGSSNGKRHTILRRTPMATWCRHTENDAKSSKCSQRGSRKILCERRRTERSKDYDYYDLQCIITPIQHMHQSFPKFLFFFFM